MKNLIQLADGELITNVLRVADLDQEQSVFFATRKGTVKKTPLERYSRPKKGGIRAIKLDDDDEVVGVVLCKPGDTLVLGSAQGKAIRFDEKAARSMGRTSFGVRGIRLREGDHVVGVLVANPDSFILTACEHGHGKRSAVTEYPVKGRGGQGVINIQTGERNGLVVGLALCLEADEAMFITAQGMIVRSPVNEMRPMGRNTQGVRLVNLKDEDQLVAVEVINAVELEEYQQITAPRRARALALEEEAESDEEEEDEGDDEAAADDEGDEPEEEGEE
jgi:DNA gyrase subunit A